MILWLLDAENCHVSGFYPDGSRDLLGIYSSEEEANEAKGRISPTHYRDAEVWPHDQERDNV